jgi:hypothetical protein
MKGGNMKKILGAVVATWLGFYGMTGTAQASLLGTIGKGGEISTLVEIDQTTGALIQTIGSVGFAVNGLTYDAITGILYGSTSALDHNFNGLITIDLTTGAGTVAGISGWGLGFQTAVVNITTDSAGNMYGWWDGSQDDLVHIDVATGAATRVGESGLKTSTNGLAFDNSDNLFMVNSGGNTYAVDTLTGSTTLAQSFGVTAHHGDFNADNLYYGLNQPFASNTMFNILNLKNKSVTTLDTVDGLFTLTFVNDTTPVPEPATMLLFGTGIAGLAVFSSRSKKR